MIKLFGSSQILNHDEQLQVWRVASVEYSDGKPVQRQLKPFIVTGNVQPISGRELELVPEHDRYSENFWVYLNNTKFTVDMGLDIQGPSPIVVNDRISRQGANYQVQESQNWGSYTRLRIVRIDVGPNRTP